MLIKKITAAVLCAAVVITGNVPTFAEEGTEYVYSETLKASAEEWNGKTELVSGKSYTVSKDITITEDVTIPSKTTVTIKKDAEIKVGRTAKLTINGTLMLNKGSELTVSGSLTLNKGKNLVCSGEIDFGKYSKIVINGKFTVKSKGEISGEPKSIKAGKNAAIKITGENDCTKLAAILSGNEDELKELESFLVDTASAAFVDGDIDEAIKKAIPKKMYKESVDAYNKMMTEEPDALTYEETVDYYGKMILLAVRMELEGKTEKVALKDFSAEFVPVNKLDDAGIFEEYYGKIENAAEVSGEFVLSSEKSSFESGDFDDILLVKSDGEWYLYITEEDVKELEDYDFDDIDFDSFDF